MSGYSQAELVAMHIADLEALSTRESVQRRLARIVQQGSDLFETHHRAKDGTIWQVQVSVTYWPFEDGRMLAFLRDVRRRSRSEALLRTRLRLSELAQAGNVQQLMRDALDEAELYTGSRIGFFHFVDEDQEHIALQAWSTNTQQRFCQAEGQGLHYAVSQAGVWADCMRLRRPVVHNDYCSLPHRKELPDGHAEIVRELVVPVIQGDHVVAIFGVGNKSSDYVEEDIEVAQAVASMAMDIVARKRAEEQLRLSEERFRRLFETMEEGCYLADTVFDAAGKCVDWQFLNVNAAYERLVGLSRDGLIGRRMSAVFPQLDSAWRAAHVSVIASAQPVRCEGSFLPAGGYYVAHLFSPDCGQVAAIISDNTRRKEDENRLAELQLQLHHTSRLATMGELAAGIAHDVNQPLCSIANFANACRNLASHERPDLQQIQEWSQAIVTAAARAGDIVRRLLGYVRHSQPDRRPSTMEQLLADALLLVQHEARVNHVSIRLENDAPNQAIEIQTVPIQQVMVNLLRNSIDALQNSAKPERHVRVHATHADGRLHVAVVDNGTGLPAEVAPRVFDPFYTTKPLGLGLGLAISRTIVEDHGGTIWATNNDEGGLTVHFTLPTN
jgi:signal transduction histidine kinase